MRFYPIAVGIICAIPIVLFGTALALLNFFEVSDARALAAQVAALGTLPASALPLLKEYLEREEGRRNLAAGKQKLIYDFRAFQMGWLRMVVYGFFVLWGLA